MVAENAICHSQRKCFWFMKEGPEQQLPVIPSVFLNNSNNDNGFEKSFQTIKREPALTA